MIKGLRAFLSLLISFLLVVGSCGVICASSVQFYLSRDETKQNRTADLTLYAQGKDDVAAFMVELTFDDRALEYKDYSLLCSDMQAEVNEARDGYIKAVFLSEDSLDCSSDTMLATFSFKALCDGNHEVSLLVADAINIESQDITAECKPGSVLVAAVPIKDNATASSENESLQSDGSESEIQDSEDVCTQGNTKLEKSNDDNGLLVFLILTVLALVCVAAFVSYKIGSKISSKGEGKNEK